VRRRKGGGTGEKRSAIHRPPDIITEFCGLRLSTPDADPSDTSFDESSGS